MCLLCSRYIVSSRAEIAKSVLSDGFIFYRLNTVKVNCPCFRLDPCDLVQETNWSLLSAVPGNGLCQNIGGVDFEDQVNTSLLSFCCLFYFLRRKKTQFTGGSMSASSIIRIVSLPFTLDC